MKMATKVKLLQVIILSAAVVVLVSTSRAQQDDLNKTLSPYFLVKGDPGVDHLPLKDTRVEIAVSGVIADVRVTQTYRNEGSRPINASYVFPASTRAAVYGMRMRIGDDVIVARIKEREAAKQEFETAKKEGKSASLLEQQRPNVFSMSMANLMPQETVEVELRYTELLAPTDSVYELIFPTVVGPRYPSKEGSDKDGRVATPHLREGQPPTSSLHISARISAGVPIRSLDCPSHRIAPEWPSSSVAQLTLDESDAFQGNRDFILRYRLTGDQIGTGLLLFEGEDENFFLFMAQPPQRVTAEDLPPREYVFVVDVSGSMEGFPLEVSKKLLTDLIGGLRPSDYFNVVLFAGDSTVLSRTPLAADEANVSRALDLLDQQRGMGGTELLAAMKEAMQLERVPGTTRSIVMVTDGYVWGEQGVYDYIRENLDDANVFSFGIGSSVNRYLIEAVAHAGLGEPFVVTDESQAPAIAERFRQYIQSPVLTDIDVRAEGFEIYDVHPRAHPDLLAHRPVVMFGKWRGTPSGTITITGRTGRGAFSDQVDVAAIRPDEANRGLRYLWARNRIAELSDYGSADISADRVQQITDLGLKYNLLTRYTSFIAVREKIVNPNGNATDVDQPLPLPVGVSDMAVGSEPELYLITFILALALAAAGIRRRVFATTAIRTPLC